MHRTSSTPHSRIAFISSLFWTLRCSNSFLADRLKQHIEVPQARLTPLLLVVLRAGHAWTWMLRSDSRLKTGLHVMSSGGGLPKEVGRGLDNTRRLKSRKSTRIWNVKVMNLDCLL